MPCIVMRRLIASLDANVILAYALLTLPFPDPD